MDKQRERKEFSERLAIALKQAGANCRSATHLANEFNCICPCAPITLHAARKWLNGEAIPTQDKLKALALWLGVSAGWLRFGDGVAHKLEAASPMLDEDASAAMVERFSRLTREHREIVSGIIDLLLRRNETIQADS